MNDIEIYARSRALVTLLEASIQSVELAGREASADAKLEKVCDQASERLRKEQKRQHSIGMGALARINRAVRHE